MAASYYLLDWAGGTQVSNSITFAQEAARDTDFTSYGDLHGIKFVKNVAADLSKLEDFAMQMVARVKSEEPNIVTPTTISYYAPECVLAHPLTTQQRAAVNRAFTPEVANFTVGVQRELAKIPIAESFERLKHIGTYLGERGINATYSNIPFHEACGEWAGQDRQFWARESFVARLAIFGSALSEIGLELHFEDAFRPTGVQEGLFKRRVAWTRRDYPEWSDEQIIQEAMSKTAVKPRLASHKAGAAVDARLRSIVDGRILDFGHEYPDGGAIVFPRIPFITANQWFNRQLFYIGSQISGLTLYIGEDWHVSYGDNLASLKNGVVDPNYTAQYGPIKAFDTDSGEITEVYDNEELDSLFDF